MSKKKAGGCPCTDAGNAELIAALYGETLRYDHKQGRWLIWNKRRSRWREDKSREIRGLAISAARKRRKFAAQITDTEKSKREITWSFDSEDKHRVDAALEIAKSIKPVSDSGDKWDSDRWLFAVSNGVVELKNGRLREERPDDCITMRSPVAFDSAAQCPRYLQFLNEIFNGDSALVEYMQRVMGYCLTGSAQEQCVFCWYGCGANGKSTLCDVLRYVFGEYAVNLPFSALEIKNRNSNDLVALAGARLATAVETNEGTRLNEARIKVLSGGDPITARRLYHESFTFMPTHKLVLAFNHKPTIADDSEGMWRRVRLIPFTRQFKQEEQDKNLTDKLRAEAPGILAWSVQGCLLWQRHGLGMPPSVAKATTEYREESDHIGEFIEDRCAVRSGAHVTSAALWKAYQDWATWNEEVLLPRQTFGERLKRRGFQQDRTGHGGQRMWAGISLLPSNTVQHAVNGCQNGDTVTQNDAISDNFSMREGIEKFPKTASSCVTTSPTDVGQPEQQAGII